jgi:uncharacterized protein with HEPN domain
MYKMSKLAFRKESVSEQKWLKMPELRNLFAETYMYVSLAVTGLMMQESH